MTTKINIKRKITVNGREFSSVEDMPEDIRHAYEQAMADASLEGYAVNPNGPKTKLVFNGREYRSVNDMPDEIHRLYDMAITAVETDAGAGSGTDGPGRAAPGPHGPAGRAVAVSPSMAPIEVGGGSSSLVVRVMIAAIVIVLLLGALYYLRHLLR
jgi:hypothetical protein